MKKPLIIITLLLFGAAFIVNAQEMTEKEKNSYAVGVILGEKLKEKIAESGIDLTVFESLKSLVKEKIDFESIKVGFQDIMKEECKITKEEIGAVLGSLLAKKDEIEALINAKKESEKKEENESQCSINYTFRIAQYYTSISYYYLFMKEYVQAEQAALKALEVDNTYLLSKTNLAHALLFQNRFADAEAIYKELSKTIYQDNETYTKALLNDFAELEKAGAIPEKHKADVEKIKQMLQK
jgi:tetratricopeptide (TPR) repeat protein